ncbi:MAG: bifunctional 3-deoxy-7-phosphoheptulonate synthase/chorismate mutase type II [Prevotella sp.]|nr:bifunctional 3-deoxy-7-phosphoheptulonate synthase/chorismate mutase type II [Prevotella sp.]MCM1074050.1 bifunctional 3-deoxy-7-phosphoheptulonate synthase/chorismate mutase type II [Ruminococcus sp.]
MNNRNARDLEYNNLLTQVGLPTYNNRILFAGPCSAETCEQVTCAAGDIASRCPGVIFRAGVWKPRTSPGCFEGVGAEALLWLKEVREQFGILTATEVALPEHIEAAEKHGIDVFWIGARTAANPFAMQTLAEAIADICPNKPVFVKNPVNPDLDLWIGALARLLNVGVCRLGAIHRGFSVYKSAPYRNAPIWQIPMELHRRLPALPILHDPSHTGGQRVHIKTLSQKALDMGFDGLMIESHPNPGCALSDGGQQLTPDNLIKMLEALKIRNSCSRSDTLSRLRMEIDELDEELLSVLARRMEVSRKIGDYKRGADMAVMQPERYSRLLTALLDKGVRLGLDATFLGSLLEQIHAESVRTQLNIINTEK